MAFQVIQEIWADAKTFSPYIPWLLVVACVGVLVVQALWYFSSTKPKERQSNVLTKAQRSKAMMQDYKTREAQDNSLPNNEAKSSMEISQIWVYPIKSLRGCRLSRATLTKEGFTYDRKFMLLKADKKSLSGFQNMQVSKIPNMCLFHSSIEGDTLRVEYRPAGSKIPSHSIQIPLEPENLENMERLDVDMYGSSTRSFNMGEKYNSWFSELFGYEVVLAYWGGNPRPVLGMRPGRPSNQSPKPKTLVNKILSHVPIIGEILNGDEAVIAFNDCAPYLVITEESGANVTSRLPDGVEMDITKFRANIVLKGSPFAFDEDFWGELRLGNDSKLILTGNCGRCVSLNVDYNTGKSGTGRDGEVLKLLSKDRRVDPGVKYSPVFGRYAFASRASEGTTLSIGDTVAISKRNEERTTFFWPGLSS